MTDLPANDRSTAAAPQPTPPAASGLDRLKHRHKQAHDTAGGCRILAADDLVRAQAMDTVRGREKLEHSAASWTARADMLQRLDESAEKRLRTKPALIPLAGLALAGALAVAGCGAAPTPAAEASTGAAERHIAEREKTDAETKAAGIRAAEARADSDIDRFEAAEKRAGRGS